MNLSFVDDHIQWIEQGNDYSGESVNEEGTLTDECQNTENRIRILFFMFTATMACPIQLLTLFAAVINLFTRAMFRSFLFTLQPSTERTTMRASTTKSKVRQKLFASDTGRRLLQFTAIVER